ncbi:MAG TPA: glycogen/starch synthase [Candidatus Limnocylindrales bacterium]|nr:glycogen/starch synthase [Candidatus Limnocylindrales bacterium]
MRIAFVAAECEPFAKTGGLGDVVDALARALGRLGATAGIDGLVDVYLPRYRGIVDCAEGDREVVTVADPTSADGASEVGLVSFEADGYRLRLVEAPAAFDRDGLYGPPGGGDYEDNGWRFGLLCHAALAGMRADAAAGRPVGLVHVHDWHSAPIALLRDAAPGEDPIADVAVVHTLHNLAYHGWVPRSRLGGLALGPAERFVPPAADGLDLLRAGVEHADLVTTVSPTYAVEALTSAFGFGLEGALAAKGDRFIGILNGLDTTLWDPATDASLAATYSRTDRSGKAACRRDLLTRIGFDPDDDGPVLGAIGRLDPQKGFDVLAEAAGDLLDAGGRIAVQGAGDHAIAEPFRVLAAARPDRVWLNEAFDRAMARRIYAGADLFVMPSRFEPSGQGQMIALRYGTPPVAHATGGLVDSIVDEATAPGAGTGFLFEAATPAGLVAACAAAAALRGDGHGAGWEALLDRGMAVDFSWDRSAAPAYAAAYRRAAAIRAGR